MIAFDLRETLRAVVEDGRREAAGRDLELRLHVDPGLPALVGGEEGRLRRVLRLLVGRAIDATTEGCVHVAAHRAEDDGQGLRVRLQVTDTGPSLVADYLFGNLDVTTLEGDPDLVLWHHLAKTLAEDLGIDSGVELGNTFWFTVRLDRPQAATLAQRTLPMASRDPGSRRVLLVEDNLVNQKVASKLIERMGLGVDVVADGQQALEALEGRVYDLVLMDCQMPVMDGYKAAQEIRNRERRKAGRVPIIALTAHAMEANRQRCLDCGMDDFVTKPVTAQQLRQVLENWLGLPRTPAA